MKPKYLYRYCSADRALQILRDQYLYLCPFDRLNDVFEGSIASAISFSAGVARELEIRRMAASGWLTREEAEEWVRDKISAKEQRENFEYFVQQLRHLNQKMRHHSGVVCFSASFSNQKMWADYGENHAGVCIQFWHDEGNSIVHKHAQPVIYTNEPRADILVESLDERGGVSPAILARLFYLTKTIDWRDEKEWRIVMLADSEQSDESRQLKFPATDIRRIFLGPRISEQKRGDINEVARPFLRDWSVVRITVDPDAGISSFHGIETIKHPDDFEWHHDHTLPTDPPEEEAGTNSEDESA